jgi:hypothetical protein
MRIHYRGALRVPHSDGRVTEILGGFAACCSGDAAWTVRGLGTHTDDRAKVTCRRCLALIAKAKGGAS